MRYKLEEGNIECKLVQAEEELIYFYSLKSRRYFVYSYTLDSETKLPS